jgi:hypothetical protein
MSANDPKRTSTTRSGTPAKYLVWCRLQPSASLNGVPRSGHGAGRDLALDAAADPLDERDDQLAGVSQTQRGVGQADAAAAIGRPRPALEDGIEKGIARADKTLKNVASAPAQSGRQLLAHPAVVTDFASSSASHRTLVIPRLSRFTASSRGGWATSSLPCSCL